MRPEQCCGAQVTGAATKATILRTYSSPARALVQYTEEVCMQCWL